MLLSGAEVHPYIPTAEDEKIWSDLMKNEEEELKKSQRMNRAEPKN